MASAWVVCRICRKLIDMKTVRWWSNQPLCPGCQKIKVEDRATKMQEMKVASTAELRGGTQETSEAPDEKKTRKERQKKSLPAVDPDEI